MDKESQPTSTPGLLIKTTSLLLVLSSMLATLLAEADSLLPNEMRIVTSIGASSDVTQVAAVYRLQGFPVLTAMGAQYLEVSAGAFAGIDETRPMLSVGPAWQATPFGDRAKLRFGITPTLIAGSSFQGEDIGGNFHFTSFIEIANQFGWERRGSIALRIQHTSNAGFQRPNPGIDMAGFSINYRFGY